MTWEVAIPSAGRADVLASKTLPMLAVGGVPPQRITVYVPSEAERHEYHNRLPRLLYGHLKVAPHDPADDRLEVVGREPVGLGLARNRILESLPYGTRLVFVDDDLRGLVTAVDAQTVTPVDDVAGLFDRGFGVANEIGASLWGVYAVANPYFMRPKVRTTLCYVCGGLFGIEVRHGPHERVVLDDKEDFERSMRHYMADGAVVRFDDVALLTSGYSGAGGMQLSRSKPRVEAAARWLADSFPDLCSLNLTKKSGWAEVRLRDRVRRE